MRMRMLNCNNTLTWKDACPSAQAMLMSRRCAGELSQASDTYSVGVLLLELITGLPAADGARAPGHHLLAQSLAPRLGDVAALQVGGPGPHFAPRYTDLTCQGQPSFAWAGAACSALHAPAVLHACCYR